MSIPGLGVSVAGKRPEVCHGGRTCCIVTKSCHSGVAPVTFASVLQALAPRVWQMQQDSIFYLRGSEFSAIAGAEKSWNM